MKLFCAGVGFRHRISRTPRVAKKSEFDQCVANGVRKSSRIQVGVDGLMPEAKNGPGFKLTPELITKALAANPFGKARTGADLGPTSTPAYQCRDFRVRPAVHLAAPTRFARRRADPQRAAKRSGDRRWGRRTKRRSRQPCTRIRRWQICRPRARMIASSSRSSQPTEQPGIFGYSYLEEKPLLLKDVPLNASRRPMTMSPAWQNIPARPLYIYGEEGMCRPFRAFSNRSPNSREVMGSRAAARQAWYGCRL